MPRPMKDSGVEWLGDIPAHWKIVQLKRLAKIQTGNTPSKTENDKYYSQESGYLWIKPEDLGNITPITSTTEYLTEEGIKYGRLLPPNTVYVCCIASVGKVGFCNLPASCNQQINGLIFYGAYWKYGFYITIAQEAEYINNASGNVMKIINSDKQSRLVCPFPPLDEQQRIATFLDGECARIDSVIEKTRASIVEYKKLKQAVITRAVTKGIRPARTMKDSGVEWLGEIPAHWNICRLKDVCNGFNNGTSKTQLDKGISDYPVTRIETISSGKINYDKVGYVNNLEGNYKLQKFDILISNINSIPRLGNCAMYFAEKPLYHGMNLLKISPENINPLFLLYSLKSDIFSYNIKLLCKPAINQASVTAKDIKNIKIAFPPLAEQKEIAQYLDEKTAAIDLLVEKKNQLVTELERLKKSLIFEYVTGKKAVAQ